MICLVTMIFHPCGFTAIIKIKKNHSSDNLQNFISRLNYDFLDLFDYYDFSPLRIHSNHKNQKKSQFRQFAKLHTRLNYDFFDLYDFENLVLYKKLTLFKI
jgi:hypothetical protein